MPANKIATNKMKFAISDPHHSWQVIRKSNYMQRTRIDLPQKWPLSRRVNSSKAPADDPSLIEEMAA